MVDVGGVTVGLGVGGGGPRGATAAGGARRGPCRGWVADLGPCRGRVADVDRGHDDRKFSVATQVRMIGNSVNPVMAEAFLRANAPWLAVKKAA